MPRVHHSVCALDCPDACSVLVTVEDGVATRLRGNPGHPVTRGFLCAKVTRYLEREYSADRLLYPQKRSGAKGEGRFARISWQEALETIAARFRSILGEYGPEAILPYSYAGTMGLLNNAGMDRRFFHRLGASRLDRTICSSPGTAGLTEALGHRYSIEPEQFRNAKLILAWGANIHGTNVHLWPFILEARRKGARFYVIDPVTTKTASLADRHYAPYPGSDAALALGMMHVILRDRLQDDDYVARHTSGIAGLEERVREFAPGRVAELTGIPAEEVESLAREYATVQPAAIRLNYGVCRSERGAMAFRAIALLPALVGAWKRPGGGLLASTTAAFPIDRAGLEMPELQLRSSLGREARLVNMARLGHALTELNGPPVKALVVYNSNPAAIAPDQARVHAGLRREDLFTVVLEQMVNDTARHADILLPATTFLEHTDLYYAYGHYHLQLARPAVAAPGEAKPNVEAFRLMARQMGFDEPCFEESEDDMIRGLIGTGHPFLEGVTIEALDREHSMRLRLSQPGEPFLPFSEGGFGTPSGRCEFRAETLGYEPPLESRMGAEAGRYRLEMVSSKNDDSMNSTLGNRPEVDEQTARLWMHSEDAAARGIADGDRVRVFNARGSCVFTALVNGGVRPGVVRAPAVRWPGQSEGGFNVNVLVSDRLSDQGGGPCFYSCLVEVEKCGE